MTKIWCLQGLVHVARKMPKNAHAHFILGLMYQRMGQADKVSCKMLVASVLPFIFMLVLTLIEELIVGSYGIREGC